MRISSYTNLFSAALVVAAIFPAGCGDDATSSSDTTTPADTTPGADATTGSDTTTGTDTATAEDSATGTGDGGDSSTTDGGENPPLPEVTDLTVPDHSGEANSLSAGGTALWPTSQGRVYGALAIAIARPTENSLDTIPLAAPADGNNAFYINTDVSYGEGGFWLLTDDTMQYDDVYELKVAVGLRKEVEPPQFVGIAFFSPDTLDSNINNMVPIHRQQVAMPLPGQWTDTTTTFRVPVELDGQKLHVGVWVRGNRSSLVFFDNFRLKRTRSFRTKPAAALIPNGSFEYPSMDVGDYAFNAVAFRGEGAGRHSGVSHHDASEAIAAADGNQVAEVENGAVMQTFLQSGLVKDKSYRVSVKAAVRRTISSASMMANLNVYGSGSLLSSNVVVVPTE